MAPGRGWLLRPAAIVAPERAWSASPLHGEGLAPSRQRAARLVRSLRLDFLGFSRPNRNLSMGYAAQSGETFFSRLLPGVREALGREPAVLACGRGGLRMGELNRGSDFQQEIVVRAGRFGPPQSKSRLVLCETEVLLAAGRRFADHHPALAQILEMGKGRKPSGTRQGWV